MHQSFVVYYLGRCKHCIFLTRIIQTLLIIAGIESNPGPNKTTNVSKLSLAHWNVDGLLARDGIKMSLIESLVEHYHFDIFAIGESCLSENVSDEKLALNCFTSLPFRVDCNNINNRGTLILQKSSSLETKKRSRNYR